MASAVATAEAREHMRRCPDHEVSIGLDDEWHCYTCEDEEDIDSSGEEIDAAGVFIDPGCSYIDEHWGRGVQKTGIGRPVQPPLAGFSRVQVF